ncbi:hypothetical protein [Dongshaea marina]|uniref:hypothetical protein n=1 Tax=Dongshaea marina TaxID=2047966 RepID=UPI000D3E816E|nr:hypothetical protein [Dongshaea marina]
MELDDFVDKVLVQVAQGVERAQATLRESGSNAVLNCPVERSSGKNSGSKLTYLGDNTYSLVESVDFDVAVTTHDESGTKGSGGIKVLKMLNAGVEASTTATSGTESRVRFSVPISLPQNQLQNDATTGVRMPSSTKTYHHR